MSDERREVFLEVDPSAAGPAPAQPTTPDAAPYLEAPDDDGAAKPSGRRKVKAAERDPGADTRDAIPLAVVAALQSDRPLMLSLWPDVPPGELLRTPPPVEAFTARCNRARGEIDAVGRRDAEARARAEIAQRRLQQQLDRLTAQGPTPRDAALAELDAFQSRDLLDAVAVLAGPQRALYAADMARLDDAARLRGIDPTRAREIVRAQNYLLAAHETRQWTALAVLPGAPATVDDVAVALLRNPAQGAEAVRAGAVIDWLRANGASDELLGKAREARQALERGGSTALAVHMQAWGLGLRAAALGAAWLRSPDEIARAFRAGALTEDTLARACREGVLPAWLRMLGHNVAAGAADLLARSVPGAMKRLAWSLGEPLVLGDQAVADVTTLARVALSSPGLREALVAQYVSGDLLAWMESLPPSLRDEQWTERLRRARSSVGGGADPLPLWVGVYQHARATNLTVLDRHNNPVALGAVAPLRVTAQVADLWDALKRAFRTGELQAWLSVVAPEVDTSGPRPPHDEERELNALLWSLGHTGLVLEWGERDLAVTSPPDLARAYRINWQLLEALMARGPVLDWLERFHGHAVLVPAADARKPQEALPLGALVKALRGEVGRLPAGWAALKLALLCGLRGLPLDPCVPGDDATLRGYVSAAPDATADPRAWDALRPHVLHGAALIWLALTPGVKPALARSLFQGAFEAWHPGGDQTEHTQRVVGAIAKTFGAPLPSAVLEAELAAARRPAGRATGTHDTRSTGSSRGGVWRALAVLMLMALGGGIYAWWEHNVAREDLPLPAARPGSEVWVTLTVELDAPRNDHGRPWDHDGSPPDLHAVVQTRDEPVEVGPCENTRHCSGRFDNVRLVPDVAFRVSVDERDPWWSERLGGVWMRWRGGRDEVIETTVGACSVRVVVHRVTVQPAPLVPVVAPVPPPAGVTARPDAGRPSARHPSRAPRRRPTERLPEPPVFEF